MTIIEFIEARLAEDEALAMRAEPDKFPGLEISSGENHWGDLDLFIAPRRLLTEVKAKRGMLDIAIGLSIHNEGQGDIAADGEDILRYLAASYSEHEDYDPQWKPPYPWDN